MDSLNFFWVTLFYILRNALIAFIMDTLMGNMMNDGYWYGWIFELIYLPKDILVNIWMLLKIGGVCPVDNRPKTD